MADFTRFISYLYDYKMGERNRNLGFAKVESRQGMCRITICLNHGQVLQRKMNLYGYVAERARICLVRLGEMERGTRERQWKLPADRLCGGGPGLEALSGLILLDDARSFYLLSVWNDSGWAAEDICRGVLWEKAHGQQEVSEQPEKISGQPEKISGQPEQVKEKKDYIGEQSGKTDGMTGSEWNNGTPLAAAEKFLEEKTESGGTGAEIYVPTEEYGRAGMNPAVRSETAMRREEAIEPGNTMRPGRTTQPEEEIVPENTMRSGRRVQPEEEIVPENTMQPGRTTQPEEEIVPENTMRPGRTARPEETMGTESAMAPEKVTGPVRTAQSDTAAPAGMTAANRIDGEDAYHTRYQADGENDRIARAALETASPGAAPEAWRALCKLFPAARPFEPSAWEVLCITLQDIGRLPPENWVWGNNHFLLHGYYQYHHLILARQRNENRIYLGVPGEFGVNEKFMAAMFGLHQFQRERQGKSEKGYWLTPVRL